MWVLALLVASGLATSSPSLEGAVRLTEGPDAGAGPVEIYWGSRWVRVCGTGWDKPEADAVCKQLGYDYGAAYTHYYFFRDTSVEVECPLMARNLTDCRTVANRPFDVTCDAIAKVTCYRANDFQVSLDDSSSTDVVVVSNGESTGAICGEGFGYHEAVLVCRHLGYTGGISLSTQQIYKANYKNVTCTGHELYLYQCYFESVAHPYYCRLASVSCGWTAKATTTATTKPGNNTRAAGSYEGQVVLVGGDSSYGRVEVWFNGYWGTVCDDGWDDRDARTVCKQLGYSRGIAKSRAFYGQGTGKIWLSNVDCYSHNDNLGSCGYDKFYADDQTVLSCSHAEDAGVECSGTKVKAIGFNRLFVGLGVMLCIFVVAGGVRVCVRVQQHNRIRNTRSQEAYRTRLGLQRDTVSVISTRGQAGTAHDNQAYMPSQTDDMPTTPTDPLAPPIDGPTIPSAPPMGPPTDPSAPPMGPPLSQSAYPRQQSLLTPQTLIVYPNYSGCYPAAPVVPPAYEDVPALPEANQLRPGQRSDGTPAQCDTTAPPPSYDSLYGQTNPDSNKEAKNE